MSDEKIIISFDEDKPQKKDDKIIIDIGKDKKSAAENKKAVSEIKYDELIINSFYKENSSLTSYSASELEYPSGIENGFGEIYSILLKDVFLNSILENNLYIIAASQKGNIYFVNRKDGKIFYKKFFENEHFEKTGFILKNTSYINSLNSIFRIEIKDKSQLPDFHRVYSAQNDYLIWSNLNYFQGKIAFLEYSVKSKNAVLKILDIENCNLLFENKFDIDEFISDSLVLGNNNLFFLIDDNINTLDLSSMQDKSIKLNFCCTPETNLLYLNDKLIFNNNLDELFFIDLNYDSNKINYSGISSNQINSLAGYNDNIFIGNSGGWEVYKTNGLLLYDFEDISVNKIESFNSNILAISKTDRIVFHNLNNFHEAEGFTMRFFENSFESDIISSVKISFDGIFVLTKNGILKKFINNKLNLRL